MFGEVGNGGASGMWSGYMCPPPDLLAAIEHYLNTSNANPKPFQWTATPESVPDKTRQGRVTLTTITI